MEGEMTLFDENVNQPLANKIDSFYSSDIQKKRLTQKERVLNVIKQLGSASDRQISERTGIARHLIPDRRLSLMKAGLVEVAYSKTDPITRKEVTYYKINGENNA